MTGKIVGTGSYVPANFLSNDELAKMVDTSDEWIRERTGVIKRHIAKEDTTTSMAVNAATRAMEDAAILPGELGMIVVSTTLPGQFMPCTACQVQKEIGAVNAMCFDMNAACSGFLVAYSTALSYMESGMIKKALVIGTECMSNQVNWDDRTTCILFGDGAGAAVVEAVEGQERSIIIHSDGQKGAALQLKQNGKITMNGQEVFRFAISNVPKVITEVLGQIHKKAEEIDYYVLHQANQRIIDAVARRLGIDINKFPSNIAEYANTSSASIPILLDELRKEKTIKDGNEIVIAAFGAGLTWGAAYIKLGKGE